MSLPGVYSARPGEARRGGEARREEARREEASGHTCTEQTGVEMCSRAGMRRANHALHDTHVTRNKRNLLRSHTWDEDGKEMGKEEEEEEEEGKETDTSIVAYTTSLHTVGDYTADNATPQLITD